MFKAIFDVLYDSQNNPEKEPKYKEAIKDLLKGMNHRKKAINSLIPITNGFKPMYKRDISKEMPLIGFVPSMSIIVYHLKNEDDIIRILEEFKKRSGNINLMSVKGEITALSTAIETEKNEVIRELLRLGADRNILTDYSYVLPLPITHTPSLSPESNPPPVEKLPTPPLIELPVVKKTPEKIEKLTIPSKLPDKEYPIDILPEFWKPIFNENELLDLRRRLTALINNDRTIKLNKNEIERVWSVCEIVQTIIPSYNVPIKNDPYTVKDTLHHDLYKDFTQYNIILCASLLILGVLSKRMDGQDYELLFKGGKAAQLVLSQIPGIEEYESEDIDVLVRPVETIKYNKAEIQNLAAHIGYLIRWFFAPTIEQMSVLLPNPETNPRGNPNIVKLSYVKNTGEFKAFSDIDFKEITEDLTQHFNNVIKYPFHIEELNTDVLFVCPHLKSIIDEKLYFYSKYWDYAIQLEQGKKITDPGYENLTLKECNFYLEKFGKPIKALTLGLIKQIYPQLFDEPVDQMFIQKLQHDYVNARVYQLGYKGSTLTSNPV
jgi:hypothetical protein